MRLRQLALWVEIVEDRRSAWRSVRVGRTWTSRPDSHRGRLIKLELSVPRDLLRPPDIALPVDLTDLPTGDDSVAAYGSEVTS